MIAANGRGVIVGSFSVAFLLAVIEMPSWLIWARPEWVTLVLIYWIVALPQRVGLWTAFSVGLLLDALRGDVIGQNALALLVVGYVCVMVYQRMRNYSLWQQALLVFVLVGLSEMVDRWVGSFSQSNTPSLQFLLSSFCSAIIWPWFMLFMRSIRRRFRVN